MSYQFLDFDLDPARYQLSRAGTPLDVPPQIFDLILLLIRHRDRPVPKSEILSSIWRGRAVTEASLTHAIAHARKLLGDTRSAQSIIKTVHGRGYWWVVETREKRDSTTGSVAGALPLVGRGPQMEQVLEMFEETRAARGSLLLVLGEAGIGKTRFSDECAARALEAGFNVLPAPCLEHEGAPPGHPWVLVVRRCIANLQQARRTTEVKEAIRHLKAVFPEIDDARPLPEEPLRSRPGDTFSIFESVWKILYHSAEGSPHLIVIDDLHRADGLSLTVLRLLVRRLGHDRLMVIGCARDGGAAGFRAAPLAELLQQPRVRAIRLEALDRSNLAALVEQLNLEPSRDFCDALLERSGGNPFFLTHLIASLTSLRSSDPTEKLQGLSGLPLSIRDAILRSLEGVSPDELSLLEIGAVVGRSFTPLLLANVAKTRVEQVVASLETCEHRGLIEPDPHAPGGVRFRHVIVRDVIYQGLPRSRRCGIHKQVAHSLRGGGGIHAPAVAHHMRCAFPLADPDEVARTTIMAANLASDRSAFSEAVHECRLALDLADFEASLSPAALCELLLTEAAARLRMGRRSDGREGLRRAASLARSEGLIPQLAETALAIAPGFFSIETGVVDPELIETLEQALGLLPTDDSVVRVRLLGNLAAALYWSSESKRIRRIVEEASEIAGRLRSREALAYASAARFVGLWSPASLEDRVSGARDLLKLADESRDRDLRLMARVFRIATFLELGEFGRARKEILSLETVSRITRLPHVQWYVPMYRAMLEITQGRFEPARVQIARMVELGTPFEDANVIQTLLLQSAEITWQTQCPTQILPAVEAHVLEHPTLTEWECAHAFLLARAGHIVAARRLASHLLGVIDDEVMSRMNIAIGLGALAETCWLLDDEDLASRLAPLISRMGTRVIVAGYGILCWGSTSRGLGHVAATLGRWDEAEARYNEALRLEEQIGAVAWLARTNVAYGQMLERRCRPGDKGRAARMREYGEAIARDLGLSRLDR